MSDIYSDLKARASEHGVVPALTLTPPPGEPTSAFLGLHEEENPEFSRLVIYDSPDGQATLQVVVETERLRALLGDLRQRPA